MHLQLLLAFQLLLPLVFLLLLPLHLLLPLVFLLLLLSLKVIRVILAVFLVRIYPTLELCLVTELTSLLVVPIGDSDCSFYIEIVTILRLLRF